MSVSLSQQSWDAYPLAVDAYFDSLQQWKRQCALNTSGGVCSFYLSSHCLRGSSCPFKHHRNPNPLVCKHYLRGLCKKGDNCEFAHQYDLSKMPTCQFFLAYGECGNPDCNFLHVRSVEQLGDCDDYALGFCPSGPRCDRAHRRLQLCADYLTGFCPRGPDCKEQHPKYELDGGRERRRRQARQRAERQRQQLLEGGAGGGDEEGRGFFTERVTFRQAHAAKPSLPLSSIVCNACGLSGHFAAQCPSRAQAADDGSRGAAGGRRMEDVQCFRCGEKGHYANVCVNTRRSPPSDGYRQQQLLRGRRDG